MAWRSRRSPCGAPPRAGASGASALPSTRAEPSGTAPSPGGAAVASSASPRRRERLPITLLTLGGFAFAREAARDDLRHAVVAHRHAVERVGGVHRALLMGDDDELRALRVAAQEREEAVDVEVVERGLDLIEDVERTRPRQEDSEQEGDRGHRLLAAREQREPL